VLVLEGVVEVDVRVEEVEVVEGVLEVLLEVLLLEVEVSGAKMESKRLPVEEAEAEVLMEV